MVPGAFTSRIHANGYKKHSSYIYYEEHNDYPYMVNYFLLFMDQAQYTNAVKNIVLFLINFLQ